MYLPQLSPSSMEVLTAAAEQSTNAEHHFLGVEHLFLGILDHPGVQLESALTKQGVETARVRSLLMNEIPAQSQRSWGEELIYTPRCHEVMQLAGKIASWRRGSMVEPAHILEAIFREGRSVPLRILQSQGSDLIALQAALDPDPTPQETATPLLDRYGRNLTLLAGSGGLPNVVGREVEIDLLEQILLRKNKNNPVLVGDAGVGKTAVVEGFAQRLLQKDCPKPFKGSQIIELSLASLVAGTKFRGEFEERLVGLVDEVKTNPNVILFVDEIHSVVGAGATGSDTMDASNILKPALARGEFRVIGATTISEYRKTIEKDAALDRRFDKIMIEEPSAEDALKILEGVRIGLEKHHEVTIADSALSAAVELTVRHLTERRLPDKAIDALDQSCARRRLHSLRDRTSELHISDREVTRTVSQWTGIPLERLTGSAAQSMLNLDDELKKRVVGQDHAVSAVASAVMTARAGLAAPNRPVGVFLFLGPTGVGKTELAKTLAEQLYGETKRLIRFDMSEYSEPHSVAKLIGAPPGYVGYDEEGLLISAVRTHPHSVVLFDEIEKAHPRLFDLFLQIFDEGRLSGSHGHNADFTQSVVIMTSNLNPQPAAESEPLGFPTAGESNGSGKPEFDVRKALIGSFRPELVNRVDEVIQFNKLDQSALRSIVDRYVGEIEAQLEDQGTSLELADDVYEHLIQQSESDTFGARELRRIVDHAIRQPLAQELLKSGGAQRHVKVAMSGDRVVFGS